MEHILYNIALVLHIVGITILAGTTFIDFLLFRQFWGYFPGNRDKSTFTGDLLYKLQRFMGIGMLLIILSGVWMMVYLHQVWGAQLWFRIKMGLLLLIIINGLAIRRRLGSKLGKLLAGDFTGAVATTRALQLKTRIRWSHLFQFLFFLAIFMLSVFKFN